MRQDVIDIQREIQDLQRKVRHKEAELTEIRRICGHKSTHWEENGTDALTGTVNGFRICADCGSTDVE